MLQGFRSRLVLSNLLITLLGLLIVVVIFTQVLVRQSTEVKKADRAAQADGVALQVEHLFVEHGKPGDLQQQIDLASRVLGVRIIVTTLGSTIPPVDSSNDTRIYAAVRRPLDPKALKEGKAAARSIFTNSNLLFFQSPLHSHIDGKVIGAVVLIARVTDVSPARHSVIQILITVLGSALLVWFAITFYFTISISRPLVRITHATGRMARGDYGARVRVSGKNEISHLAESFNDMAEKVETSDRVLRDFVANVSHDLRTPLTTIAGFSEALLDGTAATDEVEETAAVINEEALKMQRLVDDLLQLTKLESGLVRIETHPVALRPLVDGLLTRTQRAAGDRPIPTLRNDIPEEFPMAEIDETHMERVFRNLIDNAIQYTPPAGAVSVSAILADPSFIKVSVQDTGRGIAEDDLPRIFERFYRADRSRDRAQGHAGLGLAIVHEITEAHGGKVSVASALGSGTTFSVTMPRARGDARSRSSPDLEKGRPVAAQR